MFDVLFATTPVAPGKQDRQVILLGLSVSSFLRIKWVGAEVVLLEGPLALSPSHHRPTRVSVVVVVSVLVRP